MLGVVSEEGEPRARRVTDLLNVPLEPSARYRGTLVTPHVANVPRYRQSRLEWESSTRGSSGRGRHRSLASGSQRNTGSISVWEGLDPLGPTGADAGSGAGGLPRALLSAATPSGRPAMTRNKIRRLELLAGARPKLLDVDVVSARREPQRDVDD